MKCLQCWQNRFNKSLDFLRDVTNQFAHQNKILNIDLLSSNSLREALLIFIDCQKWKGVCQELLCCMNLTLFQRNIHLLMKSDECHCVQYNHIYQPMNGQLTMSRPRLHLIRVFHVLPKVHALFKSLLSICLFLTKSILFVQNILSKRNTNLYDCIRNDLRFFFSNYNSKVFAYTLIY